MSVGPLVFKYYLNWFGFLIKCGYINIFDKEAKGRISILKL